MAAAEGDRPALAAVTDRQTFTVAVDEALAAATGTVGVRSVTLLEITSFDLLNEAFGPEVGLGVVRCCADQLIDTVHPGDLVARLSDHAFAVWCPHVPSNTEAHAYGDHLRRQLVRPSGLRHVGGALQVSAGVAVATAEVSTAADLLQRGRTALFDARPDSTTKLYEAAMRDVLMRRVELETIVTALIERGGLDLAYQPIVRLDDQRTVGAEALLRVIDTSGSPIPPDELVDAAEQSGQIDELGDLILQTACAAAAQWRREVPGQPIQLTVNVSGRQLDDATLPSRVAAALDASGLDAASLWLEITESALMRNPTQSTALLAELKARGIRLAADDFGTGYSSLAYLKTFPLDALKIDRTFVSALPTGQQEVAITRAVVAVADALGLEVIAEGIECHDQRDCVIALGAALGQGYLWSPAVPADAFAARLSEETDAASNPAGTTSSMPGAHVDRGSEASADEHVDALLEVLAHEIRNPLAVVHGYADLIESGDLADDRLGGAAIQRAASRIDEIVKQLTSVSLRAGRGDVAARTPVDLGAAVERIVADFRLLTPVDLQVVEHLGPAIIVSADATQIEQALTNLVGNAIRFSPTAVSVEVAVRADRLWTDIDVSDAGPGVDPADMGLLFCKYGRADPASPGAGLGLYLARRIARAHGGDILVRRRTGGPGMTFTIRLPRLSGGGRGASGEGGEGQATDASGAARSVIAARPGPA